ncbi:unnamed protein product [Microthlaspi erraticum]|uniref:Uncharacterized protein n=1 Tax=Microthlaspi erraticum TaxID=1685480 RepID=A0A6D2HGN3_9BRAS|nr:unnamed protein product [Microthlaspi erraticum]
MIEVSVSGQALEDDDPVTVTFPSTLRRVILEAWWDLGFTRRPSDCDVPVDAPAGDIRSVVGFGFYVSLKFSSSVNNKGMPIFADVPPKSTTVILEINYQRDSQVYFSCG